ncbi:MAG: lactate utilization protein [Flavitalea sp.]
MLVSASKENILKKIRKALTQSTPIPFPASEGTGALFNPGNQDMEIEFGEQFSKLLGKFLYCADENEFRKQLDALIAFNNWENIFCKEDAIKQILPQALVTALSDDLTNAQAALTTCEALVARTGTIIMSSAQQSGRLTSVYASVHICVAYTNQLVYDVKDGLQLIKEKYTNKIPSLVTFATGPSRTADIEKTLVVGVHGPKEVYVFLIEK